MTLLQTLQSLSAVDHEWDTKGRQYQSIRKKLADTSELDAARAEKERLARLLAETGTTLRNAELLLSTLQQKVAEVERDLYGGRIRAPKELEALRADADQLKRQIATHEDEMLGAMGHIDELRTSLQQASESLDALEREWAREQQVLSGQAKVLRTRLLELQQERERLRAGVGGSDLALYDELRASKAGVALAPFRDGLCQVCRVMVPAYKVSVVSSGETVVTCDGCGRILVRA
ncbi:MAG: zinc ribbon domain-containing protein [Anaerolineae bacterium]